jgi:hypothetical protein
MTASDSICGDMHATTLLTLWTVTGARQCNSGEAQLETMALYSHARRRAESRLEGATSRPAARGTLLSGAAEHGSGYICHSILAVVDLIAAVIC